MNITQILPGLILAALFPRPLWAVIPGEVALLLDLPETPYNYTNVDFPAHFNAALATLDNTPVNPTQSDAIATLGRVLFYEKKLSANATVACASCHIQDNGFSDPGQFSEGFAGGLTDRNSMGLANNRFYENGHFFWDERADTLEDQVLEPIQNDVEMGLSLSQAVSNINAQSYSDYLFSQAFGSTVVTSGRISTALSQYLRSIVSYQTSFDIGLAQTGNVRDNFPNYTPAQNDGKALFFSGRTQCANCHVINQQNNQAVFQPANPLNNGLDAGLSNPDNGLGAISGLSRDNGKFKVSSLRNIGLTAPYMHDGRFLTLQQVIEHYNSGVQNHPNLEPQLRVRGNQIRRLNLSNTEKQDIEEFLLTLTDSALIADIRFSNPFFPPTADVNSAILYLLLGD